MVLWQRKKWSPTAINTTMISCESIPIPEATDRTEAAENERPEGSKTDPIGGVNISTQME